MPGNDLRIDPQLVPLVSFLKRVPAIRPAIGAGPGGGDVAWWVKFSIDVDDPLAWHVVQQLGHVLNYLSLNQRLPTVFMPVSPPPLLNGGPEDYLSWVIECSEPQHTPEMIARSLADRLPDPVDDRGGWDEDD